MPNKHHSQRHDHVGGHKRRKPVALAKGGRVATGRVRPADDEGKLMMRDEKGVMPDKNRIERRTEYLAPMESKKPGSRHENLGLADGGRVRRPRPVDEDDMSADVEAPPPPKGKGKK